jgi:hypothetical protein
MNVGADVRITAFAIVVAEIAPVVTATVATAAVVTTYSLHQEFVEGERDKGRYKTLILRDCANMYKTIAKHSKRYTI